MQAPRLVTFVLVGIAVLTLAASAALASSAGHVQLPAAVFPTPSPVGPETSPAPEPTPTTPAVEDEGPGTDQVGWSAAVHDCRELDGREICDTFDEVDEGPGTR